MPAPRPERRPHAHTAHGLTREDPYHWLRNRDDPAVAAYLEANNAHTEAQTAHLAPLRAELNAEILGRIQETDSSVPTRDGPWRYYHRTVEGLAYPIWCRRRDLPDAAEEILLDENTLLGEQTFLDVGFVLVSPDHATLAWGVDHDGDEVYDVSFRALDGRADLPDRIEGVGSATWATDGRTLLYTRLDETLRPCSVHAHALGTDLEADPELLREDDETFRVGIGRSSDDRRVFLIVVSPTCSEWRWIDAASPLGPQHLISARHPGHEYEVDSQGDRLLILTNDSDDDGGAHDDRALTFALKTASPDANDRHAWQTIIPARPDVTLEGLDVFATFVVLHERERGLVHLRVLGDGLDHRIGMPETAWSVWSGQNPEFHARAFRFGYTSLVTPPSVMQWQVDDRRLETLKESPVRGGYDRGAYQTRRLWARSADGAAIPISLVHRRDLPLDRPQPTLLYGYGAYGVPLDPTFSSSRLSLLDRGVVYAIVHARGGADLGRAWYEAARRLHKQRSFDDLIAAADALFDAGFTAPDRLAIEGGSAGGLLVAAAINQAPERFRAAIADVPFVDVVTTMCDPTLPLTTSDYPEWGHPDDPDAFRAMLAWSPIDNVKPGPLPALFVTAGFNDPRVAYWEPAKWVARLRDVHGEDAPVLLHVWMGAGHGGSSGRYGWIADTARSWAWLLDALGLANTAPHDTAR